MTPEQVIAASSGTAGPSTSTPEERIAGYDRHAQGKWSEFGFEFTADFYFDNGKTLKLVLLKLEDFAQCPELRRILLETYGPALESTRVSERWHIGDDDVRLADAEIIEVCRISYSPFE